MAETGESKTLELEMSKLDEETPQTPQTPSNGSPRHRRRSSVGTPGSILDESLLHDWGPPDCGTKTYKHLHYKKALDFVNKNHPRIETSKESTVVATHGSGVFQEAEVVIEYQKYPICATRTGKHVLCGKPGPSSKSEFSKYGVGMTLYFMFLKYLVNMFAVMTVCYIPAMLFYGAGGGLAGQVQNGIQSLSLVTLGNLGEGTSVCADAPEGGQMILHCANPNQQLYSFKTYYGNPTGSCGCPTNMRPTAAGCTTPTNGVCPAGKFCFRGKEPTLHDQCCSDRLSPSSLPDFAGTAAELLNNVNCSSTAAGPVIDGLCEGLNTCTFTVSAAANYSWKVGRRTFFGSINDTKGGLARCTRPKHMFVVAKCFDDTAFVLGQGWTSWLITQSVSLRVSKGSAATVSMAFGMLAILIFLYGSFWLRRKEEEVQSEVDEAHITCADYTVMLENLPPHPSLDKLYLDLIKHFEYVLTYSQAARDEEEERLRVRVADVNFGYNDTRPIKVYTQRGTLIRRLEKREKEISALEKLMRKDSDPSERTKKRRQARLEKLKAKRAEVQAEMMLVEAEIGEWETGEKHGGIRATTAFVTFEQSEALFRCLNMYPSGRLQRLLQPRARRFRFTNADGKFPSAEENAPSYRLYVSPAPEPSDIKWANLEAGPLELALRSLFTFFVCLLLIAISMALIILAKQTQVATKNAYPSPVCSALAIQYNITGGVAAISKQRVVEDRRFQYFNKTIGNLGFLGCYCKEYALLHGPAAMFGVTFPDPVTGQQQPWCQTWSFQQATQMSLMLVGAAGVVIINLGIKFIFAALVKFERHHTVTAQLASLTLKLFVVQLLNTAFVVLLVNASLQQFGYAPSPSVPLFAGSYSDFNPLWYLNVGSALTLTMLINVGVPHISTFVSLLRGSCSRCCDRSCTHDLTLTKQSTQAQLEELQLGPQFLLPERYAQILNTIFVTLMYSSGMPLLLPLAALSFVFTYWVDKLALLRLYRTPPAYDHRMAAMASSSMIYAVCLHLTFGMWMLSNQNIFAASSAVGVVAAFAQSAIAAAQSTGVSVTRLFNAQSLPLFLMLLLIAAYLLLYKCLWRALAFLVPHMAWMDRCCAAEEARHEDIPDYTDAIDLKRMRGITTYDLQANKEYTKSFALDVQMEGQERKFLTLFTKVIEHEHHLNSTRVGDVEQQPATGDADTDADATDATAAAAAAAEEGAAEGVAGSNGESKASAAATAGEGNGESKDSVPATANADTDAKPAAPAASTAAAAAAAPSASDEAAAPATAATAAAAAEAEAEAEAEGAETTTAGPAAAAAPAAAATAPATTAAPASSSGGSATAAAAAAAPSSRGAVTGHASVRLEGLIADESSDSDSDSDSD